MQRPRLKENQEGKEQELFHGTFGVLAAREDEKKFDFIAALF